MITRTKQRLEKKKEKVRRLEFLLKIFGNIFEKNMLFNLIENRIRKKTKHMLNKQWHREG